MADHRSSISRQIKRALLREAGEKCANPGCGADRTQFHHIREWHVYRAHDERHMIAICPNCHDAVHHGQLEISDETLYRWKGIHREPVHRGHLYVEPRSGPVIELGSNRLIGPSNGYFAFDLSPRNRPKIRIADNEILLVSFTLSALSGQEVIRFHENYWKRNGDNLVAFAQVPGHIRITTTAVREFLPDWVREAMRKVDPGYAANEELLLLDIEVAAPGFVKIQGLWVDDYTAVVATSEALYFIGCSNNQEPVGPGVVGGCTVDVSQNGVVSPTLFGISYLDRDRRRFSVKIGN